MNLPQSWTNGRRQAQPSGFAVVMLVCIVLLALLAVVQVAHVHAFSTDADHCPLCIVMHSAAPIALASAVIVLVQQRSSAPVLEARAVSTFRQNRLFIRPPPQA